MNKFQCSVIIVILFIILSTQGWSQGLCNNSNFEAGGFDLSADEICVSQTVRIKDKSRSKNVRYIYDYQLESFDEINRTAVSTNSFSFKDIGKSKVYTILQVGEINGKASIACRNLTVRANNIPEHSFTVCNSLVEFNVPKHSLNNFDSYVLEVDNQYVVINKSDLPFKKAIPITLPSGYRISGYYSDLSKNCSISSSFKNIPAKTILTSLPFHPNIDKLELLNLSTLKLAYSGPYSVDTSLSTTLYRFEKTMPSSSAVAIYKNITPGVYEFAIPDSTKSYCFFAKKKNFCGNEVQESAEICTHPLFSAKFNPHQFGNELTWDKYPTLFKGKLLAPFATSLLSGVSYNTSQQIKFNENNTNLVGFLVPKDASDFNHKLIDCKKRNCYSIEQTISGTFDYIQYYGVSISNKICIDQSKVPAPPATNLYVSTENKQNNIYAQGDNSWPLKKEQWFLYKQQNKEYHIIDTLQNDSVVFIDSSHLSKAETYKVRFLDQCNSLSKLSDSVSSIYLDVSIPNSLKWTNSSPFSNAEVANYEIYHFDDSNRALTKIGETKFNSFEIDLNLYSEKGSFLIMALSSKNDQTVSMSNIKTLHIPSTIFIPTVFTPNSDGINDLLEIKGKINSGDIFELKIFNRLGQQLVKMDSITDKWDGTFNGKDLESGIYPYLISIISNNGNVAYKSGSLSILRN